MRERPLVSIILAAYNWTSVLGYAMRSVIWQTFSDWELLVVGDACTDDTAQVVASFDDPRIRWHNLAENTGNQSGPNNAGLAMAGGKYIAYIHQDDLWLPDHLGVLVAALEPSDAVLAHALALVVGPPPELGRWIAEMTYGTDLGSEEVFFTTPAVMHRADAAREVGGWRDWRTVYEQPQNHFFRRLLEKKPEPLSVRELTVVKFHSALRRNSYLEKCSAEQATYFERIGSEPDFRYRELLQAAHTISKGIVPRDDVQRPDVLTPGWAVAQFRRLRGLEEKVPSPGALWGVRRRPLLICLLAWLRDLFPLRLRKPVGQFIVKAGHFVARAPIRT